MGSFFFVLLVAAGFVSGFANTLASSGSAVTLPALMLFGFPPHVANATNRVALVIGAITRLIVFQKAHAVDWAHGIFFLLPAMAGALAGAWLSEQFSNLLLTEVIIGATLLALILVLTGAKQFIRPKKNANIRVGWVQLFLIFLVGGWAGFIVLDSGTYLLMVLVLSAGYDLVKANPVKALLTFGASVTSACLFYSYGDVDWLVGIVLSIGSIAGSWLGAKIALQDRSRRWIYALLVAIISAELIRLGLSWL